MQAENSDQGGLRRLFTSFAMLAVVSVVGWILISQRRELNELRNQVQEMKSLLKQHEQVHQIESENAELRKQIEATKRALETAVP
jgi:cyanate permease